MSDERRSVWLKTFPTNGEPLWALSLDVADPEGGTPFAEIGRLNALGEQLRDDLNWSIWMRGLWRHVRCTGYGRTSGVIAVSGNMFDDANTLMLLGRACRYQGLLFNGRHHLVADHDEQDINEALGSYRWALDALVLCQSVEEMRAWEPPEERDGGAHKDE